MNASRFARALMVTLVVILPAIAACAPAPAPTAAPTRPTPPAPAPTRMPAPDTPPPAVSPPGAATTGPATAPVVPAAAPIRGVFEGITPCSALTRPLPQIPADTDCEEMIWKFTLFQDPQTRTPTTYTLNSAYGVPLQGTTGLDGGTAIAMEGSWAVVVGTRENPGAEVYQLRFAELQNAVSFVKLSDDMLHVLNRDRALMVGNGGWSYTLNRTDNRRPILTGNESGEPPLSPTRPPIPPVPPGSSVAGVFEGRTPCHAIVYELTGVAPFDDCIKIKWKLTLYRDQTTGEPDTYLYQGTTTIRGGAWTITRGTRDDPDALVYQLHLDGARPPVSFLAPDENHLFLLDRDLNLLVGDALWSYTLSRTGTGTP